MKNINEISTSRILRHLKDGETLAMISTFRPESERDLRENMRLLNELKRKVRSKGLGFTEFIARWSAANDETGEIENSDERSLMIYGISKDDAIQFGKDYNQDSIIFKDETGCYEICTRDGFRDWISGDTHKVGDIVQKFNVEDGNIMNIDDASEIFQKRRGGPASMPVKSNRPFHLSEAYRVIPPRPSYFHKHENYSDIFCEDETKSSSLIKYWAKLAEQNN